MIERSAGERRVWLPGVEMQTRLVAVLSTGVCAGSLAWVRWWPHSDNRQNLAVVGISLLIATSVIAWAVLLSTKPRLRDLGGLVFAIALVGVASFAIFALSTANACGDCPPF